MTSPGTSASSSPATAEWLPPKELEDAISHIAGRARQAASAQRARLIGAAVVDAARQNVSGGPVHLAREAAALGAIEAFGASLLADVKQLFQDSYGTVPPKAVGWIKTNLGQRVAAYADDNARLITPDQKELGFTRERALELTRRAAYKVSRDID